MKIADYVTEAALAVVILAVGLLLPAVSHALPIAEELVGLTGVQVLVEEINPKTAHLGLTKDQINTDVELRLRKAGVNILTFKENSYAPGKPTLHVNVGVGADLKGGICPFSVRVELHGWVKAGRGFDATGAIWHTESLGEINLANIGQLRQVVDDQVDRFINAYLAANPKRPGGGGNVQDSQKQTGDSNPEAGVPSLPGVHASDI